MDRRHRWYLLLGVAVVAITSAAVALPYFLPERSVTLNEATPAGSQASETLAAGTFEGRAGHAVSGTVKLLRIDGAFYLRFEDYNQTQGPDVFVYLTPSPSPDTDEEIYDGIKVLIDGGADGGEITKEGSFNQRLPDGVDPTPFLGVGIWCDRFSVPFGIAELRAA